VKSPWNILRQDEELRAEIQQDVERCMPEEPYFRQAQTQRMLLNILFIFCKMNQDVGYRQGMHELLAPILWVVENDTLSIVNMQTGDSSVDSRIIDTLSASFLEHDAFTLFSSLMQSAKTFYELGEPDKRTSITLLSKNQSGTSPIVDRSKRIHEVYLASLDPELADHLTAIEVLPQIFLM
jgi:TBC1 domain family member 5